MENFNRLNDLYFKKLLGDKKRKNLTLSFLHGVLNKDDKNYFTDKIERRAYEQREKAIRDYYSYMNAFKEEGLQQGLEQGMQKGLYQQAIQTAKNMLKDKVDIKLISKYTNLSVEEIKKINEE